LRRGLDAAVRPRVVDHGRGILWALSRANGRQQER
jgi:hypothetical protein